MRIIVMSDTHSQMLPKVLLEDMKQSDLVLHLGDFTGIEVLNLIRAFKEVRAVYGNMDSLELRKVLPQQDILQCEKVRIALFHGEGPNEGMLDRIRERFKAEKVEAIVFGHSHQPMNEVIDGILFFNPGSPTDEIRAPYRSYGVLEVEGDQIRGQIVKIK
jgi:putative phosphoesterase